MTRKLAASVLLLLLLAACRSKPERNAVARTTETFDEEAIPAPESGQRGESGATQPVGTRRLWAGGDFNFFASSPSPDGRFVTEIDWTTGDLAVRDLATGRLHRVTDKGPWEASSDYAEVARFSADGRQIAYSWWSEEAGTYEIRVLDFDLDERGIPRGSAPRVVHPGGPLYAFWLYGWTAQGELLAGLYRPDNSTALGFVSLSTGDVRVLRSFDWSDPHAVLSPDGRFIAYDHPADLDERERDIYLLSADGTDETTLIAWPGRDIVLGWAPDGASLLFHSDRSGTPSIYRLRMVDGRPTGRAELVREDVRNLEPLGFAGNAFYFGVEIETPAFRTASLNVEAGRLLKTSTVLDAPYGGGRVQAVDWSPDGRHVVQAVAAGPAGTRIFVRSADGTVIHQWSFPFRLLRWLIRWSPDGRSLLLSAQDNKGRSGFFRIDLESGEIERLRRFDSGTGRLFSVSPDGRSLYFTQVQAGVESDDRVIDVMVRDLSTGDERAIDSVRQHDVHLGASHWSPLAASPDGRSLAYPEFGPRGDATVQLLPLDGHAPRILYRIEPPYRLWEIVGWDLDGASLVLLVSKDSDEDETWSTEDVELWTVSRSGGDATRIGEIDNYVRGARLHPDGRTIVYQAGRSRGEIWALEGAGARSTAATHERTSP